ncbi:hypothetical protein ALC62_11727, partial [Cyphomyrmex costatus]
VSVFAYDSYEKGEGSARNFSDWLVEESRIVQPDSSCRGKSVDVRNGRTNESEHTTGEPGSTQFYSVSLAFVKNGQPGTSCTLSLSLSPWRTPPGRERDADRTYLFLLEAVRKRPQDSARHHAVVHPVSPAVGRDGGLPSGGHLFPPAGHLLELHQSNVHAYTLYESSVHLYRRAPCIHRAAFITLRVRTYRRAPRALVVEREEEGRILFGEKAIRVMVVLASYFYFATAPTSLYSLAIRRNYTGTCHEESHLGSRRLCGLP